MGDPIKINTKDGRKVETTTTSKFYRDQYDAGNVSNSNQDGSFDLKDDVVYDAGTTQTQEISTKANKHSYGQFYKDYEKHHPMNRYIQKEVDKYTRDQARAPKWAQLSTPEEEMIPTIAEEAKEKYIRRMERNVAKRIHAFRGPKKGQSRVEWLDGLQPEEERLVKEYLPQYQTTLWQDTKRGLQAASERTIGEAILGTYDNKDLSKREKAELLASYKEHPILTKLGDLAKMFSALDVGSKLVQSMYREDYSWKDALRGIKSNTTLTEDVVTGILDPTNLVGAGIFKNVATKGAMFGLGRMARKAGKNAVETAASSADNVGRNLDEIYKNRIFYTDESRDIKNIPWNREADRSVQDEFIDEQIEYMNSSAFAEKMETYYPDVDIEDYKKSVLHNLKEKITSPGSKTYPDASLDSKVGGWYTPRDNTPDGTVLMPGYPLNFKRKVRLATEEILKPAYQYREDAGKSFTRSLGSTIEHELGHQRTNSNWLLPDYLTKEYLTENISKTGKLIAEQEGDSAFGFAKYHSNPTEFDTRLLNMKKDLKRQGIIDYTKSNDFTPEMLDRLDILSTKPADKAEMLKELEEALSAGNITQERYEKAKKWLEKSKNLVTQGGDVTSTKDSVDLLKYWDKEFLAEQMRRLPLAPIVGATAAGAALGAGAISQESKDKLKVKKKN
jgi:hypothetical protein